MVLWRRVHGPRDGWIIKGLTAMEDAVQLSKDTPRGKELKTRPNVRLELKRKVYTDDSTIGDLYFDRKYECRILEDTWRDPNDSGQLDADEKISGVTCIPTGVYRIVWTYSNRFKEEMFELLDVPLFSGIRIHSGNRAKDTAGCLITGTKSGEDMVWLSKQAYNLLKPRLRAAIKKGKVYISIKNDWGGELERT